MQCNSEFDQYSKEYYREFIDDFTFDKDSSVLEIGLKGVLRSIECEVIGRVRYQDESVATKSTWDEWIFKTSNGKFACIIEENNKIYFYQEYTRRGGNLPPDSINISKSEQKNPSIEFNGEAVKTVKSYTGRIVLIEGDIACKAEIGDRVQFYDFKRHGEDYTLKRCNKIDKFLSGERLSLSELIGSFNITKFQESCNRMNNKWRALKQESRIYAACMIILLIVSVYNCFGGIPVKGIMNSKSVISENLVIANSDDKVYESQILYGAFNVPEKDRLYSVYISRDGESHKTDTLKFRLMFINENKLTETLAGKSDTASLKETFDRIDAFLNPVESYAISGRISSGIYELNKTHSFIVDESGKYFFYLEIFSDGVIDINAISISMSRTDSYRYYLIAAFIFLILSGICNKYSIRYKEFTKNELTKNELTKVSSSRELMVRGIIISLILILCAYIFTSQSAFYKTSGKEYMKAVKNERQTIKPTNK